MLRKMDDSQWATLKKVMKYLKKYRIYLICSILLAAVTVISTLYIPILTGDAVDHIIAKGRVDFAGTDADLGADDCCDRGYGGRTVGHE